jgi:hypothetical protein
LWGAAINVNGHNKICVWFVHLSIDGIFGHQFKKRLESFAPFTVPSTGGFERKLPFIILTKNPQNKKTQAFS